MTILPEGQKRPNGFFGFNLKIGETDVDSITHLSIPAHLEVNSTSLNKVRHHEPEKLNYPELHRK
ncbi:MAG: hypothetical protein EA359_07505 [Balneolaceae bacterium]|nr:MAG: hypothetical protein EA359_07505 [Balneolaceae bacterium]